MKIAAMFALLISTGVAATAQTRDTFADFQLDPVVGLSSSGSPLPDAVGQWLTPNAFNGYATVRYTWDDGSVSWNQDTYTSAGLPLADRSGEPFGPRREQVMPALATGAPTSRSLLEPGHLLAAATSQHPWDEANAGAGWDRTFSLLPNTSITFSGTVTLGSNQATTQQTTFEAAPNLNPQYANRGILSVHSSPGDGRGWINGISFIARIMNFDPRLPAGSPSLGREGSVDDFAYSSDAQGHVSLTLFNHSDDLMFTNLSLSAFAVAPFISPIPEPSGAASMLLGLGLLAWRRRSSRPSSSPPVAGGLA